MSPEFLLLIAIEGVLFLMIAILFPTLFWHAPFIPTPHSRVHRMLELAGVKKGETVVDLGAGDGRVLHCAVKHFGAKGVGVERSIVLVFLGNFWLLLSGLKNSAKMVRQNMFQYDCSGADVVIVFLLQTTNQQIKEKLLKELKSGSRVVSRIFKFNNWPVTQYDKEYNLSLYKKT